MLLWLGSFRLLSRRRDLPEVAEEVVTLRDRDRKSLVGALLAITLAGEIVACFLRHRASSLRAMPRSVLASSWAKLYWGQQHLERVDEIRRRVFDANDATIPIETKLEGHTIRVWAGGAPMFDDTFALTIGDAVQNFRAALDHLVWDLVRLGNNPRPAKPLMVQFPMAKSAENFGEQLGRRLPGVPDPQRAIIKRYQPYRRDGRGKAIKALHTLSIRDKHRFLAPTVVNTELIRPTLKFQGCKFREMQMLHVGRRALDRGTELMRITVSPTAQHFSVKVDLELTVRPAFSGGISVLPTLWRIRDVVREVLSEFDRIL